MCDNAEVSTNNDTPQTETIDKNVILLDKDQLVERLYKLNEDNLMLSEQLKQYRTMVETLERKLNEMNDVQNKKHQQITDTLLQILVQKKKLIKGGAQHSKKRSKHSKARSKKRHSSKRSKHSKRRTSKNRR